MCGLAGLALKDSRMSPADGHKADVATMLSSLAHRGPDGEAMRSMPGVVLGHRRLAIIDLSDRAAQPMPLRCRQGGGAPDGASAASAWIVFNGEVYNYVELRRDLDRRGHRFHSDSDTETILHLYEEEGPACLRHLRGMYAFALWDARERRLLLARDRMGEKPLFYTDGPEGLAFASEVKALAAMQRGRGRAVESDSASIARYLALKYVPGPATAIRGVMEVPPAGVLILQDGQVNLGSYWNLPVPEEQPRGGTSQAGPSEELRGELREAVDTSVRLRMRSDVPLGLFLSGGLDSGIIASAMTRAGAGRVRTFTVGFGEKDYDELADAAKTAAALGTEHREIMIRPTARETVDLLPELAFRLDQPFADSSALAMHHLSAEVRRHVTVALSGDGADELFLGYDRYRAHHLADRARFWLGPALRPAAALARGLAGILPLGPPGRRNVAGRVPRFLAAAGMGSLPRNDAWITSFDESLAGKVLAHELIDVMKASLPLAAHHRAYADCRTRDALIAVQRADLRVYLPDDILRKVDLASMTHGLEARAPFLDHELVELALRVPVSMKLRSGHGKAILREAFGGELPRRVIRGRKAGFGLPLDHWLRGGLSAHARELLLAPRTLSRGLTRRDGVESLLDAHASGRANHEEAIWSLVMLEHWFREAMDHSASRQRLAATQEPA